MWRATADVTDGDKIKTKGEPDQERDPLLPEDEKAELGRAPHHTWGEKLMTKLLYHGQERDCILKPILTAVASCFSSASTSDGVEDEEPLHVKEREVVPYVQGGLLKEKDYMCSRGRSIAGDGFTPDSGDTFVYRPECMTMALRFFDKASEGEAVDDVEGSNKPARLLKGKDHVDLGDVFTNYCGVPPDSTDSRDVLVHSQENVTMDDPGDVAGDVGGDEGEAADVEIIAGGSDDVEAEGDDGVGVGEDDEVEDEYEELGSPGNFIRVGKLPPSDYRDIVFKICP